MTATADDGVPRVFAADRAEWRRWLEGNSGRTAGVWLVYETGPGRRLSHDDIVEEALCCGWVDSRARGLGDARSMLYMAPRKPSSKWSRSNKERITRLTAAGLMTPAGEAAVAAARANGSRSALDDVENLVEPDDLRGALDAEPAARQHWDGFPRSVKRAILEWLASAKRPQTRQARIVTIVGEAAEGRRANQRRQPGGRG